MFVFFSTFIVAVNRKAPGEGNLGWFSFISIVRTFCFTSRRHAVVVVATAAVYLSTLRKT